MLLSTSATTQLATSSLEIESFQIEQATCSTPRNQNNQRTFTFIRPTSAVAAALLAMIPEEAIRALRESENGRINQELKLGHHRRYSNSSRLL